MSLKNVLSHGQVMLEERQKRGLGPAELAFYGGTFTGQKIENIFLCIKTAKKWLDAEFISHWRCSTRPDALSSEILHAMRENGCTSVELGVQSLENAVLAKARRGCTVEDVLAGIALVKEAGLRLGVQLLPGLPGASVEGFLSDVKASLRLGADFLRFYPCIVLRGTGLERLWRAGSYTPWDLATAVRALAEGLLLAGDVPVIRLGVAYEEAMRCDVLAGPFDATLGERARSLALLLSLERSLPNGERIIHARIPRTAQGLLYGHAGEHKARLQALGIGRETIEWTHEADIILETAAHAPTQGCA